MHGRNGDEAPTTTMMWRLEIVIRSSVEVPRQQYFRVPDYDVESSQT